MNEEVYFDHYTSKDNKDFPIDNISYEQAIELFNNINDKDSYACLEFGEL